MNILLPGLDMDTNYAVQVRPSGDSTADWSPIFSFRTVIDTNPPPKPSTPILSNGLGTIIVNWDGNDFEGNRMYDVAPDTVAVEVHVGTLAGFTPTESTMVGHIVRVGEGGGDWVVSGQPYGTALYVKLVAIDGTNLASVPSDEVTITVERVSGLDIEDGAIGPDKVSFSISGTKTTSSPTPPPVAPDTTPNVEGDLWVNTSGTNGSTLNRWDGSAWQQIEWGPDALGPGSVGANALAAGAIVAGSAVIGNGAIQSAQIGTGEIARANIADAAIDDAKIANLSAGKITAGTMSAQIILGGSIVTATTGARVTLDSTGLKAYDSSNSQTVNIGTSVGSNFVTGSFKTSVSGARLELNPGSSGGSVQIYDSYGNNSYLQASGGPGGGGARVGSGDTYIDLGDSINQVAIVAGGTTSARFGSTGITSYGLLTAMNGSNFAATTTYDLTVGTGYTLYTNRIQAVDTGYLRLEPSINVVSQITYSQTTSLAANMYVGSNGVFARSTSSAKYKVNIDRDAWVTDAPLDAIKRLRPTTYWDKADTERLAKELETHGPLQEFESNYDAPRQLLGLIAEDVDELGLTDLVVYTPEGEPDAVMYDRVAVALIPWINELDSRLTEIESQLTKS